MSMKTMELMVYYYENACGSADVEYARKTMAEAERLYATVGYRLNIWPPDRRPYRETVLPRLDRLCFFNDEPSAIYAKDVLEMIGLVIERGTISLPGRLPAVFGRFSDDAADGRAYTDKVRTTNGVASSCVFVNTKYRGRNGVDPSSVLAHEIGHAAGHWNENTENKRSVMYYNGTLRLADPIIDEALLWYLPSAFFVR